MNHKPEVSIVIPSRGLYDLSDHQSLLLNAVKSITSLSTYNNYEIVCILDSGFNPGLVEELEALVGDKLVVLVWEKPFNFSLKMNFGVSHSRGEYILLLNDDVELITPNWIEKFIGVLTDPEIAMVGCMLYFEDFTIQHAGHLYFKGSPTHIGIGHKRGNPGPNDNFMKIRQVSGVTAACALIKTKDFLSAGGFSGMFPGNFNDVDLCLKLGYLGRKIFWTPDVELIHFESKTRDATVFPSELQLLHSRWSSKLDDSRFWEYGP